MLKEIFQFWQKFWIILALMRIRCFLSLIQSKVVVELAQFKKSINLIQHLLNWVNLEVLGNIELNFI